MRILLLTQLFQPEPNLLKGLAFAKELQRRGHEVEVLTGFPNYPGGKIYPGYRQRMLQRESLEGIQVSRIPSYLSHDRSSWRRFLSYSSFAFVASIWGIFRVKRPDLVLVYQGPATLVLPALLMRFFWRIPYVLDIQDLWPESVSSSGMMSSRLGIKLLHAWCDYTYKHAARILVLSPGYKAKLVERNVEEKKVALVYNWSADCCQCAKDIHPDIAERFDSTKFNIVYAGNIGKLQALDSVITAASLIRDEMPNVLFKFFGEGVESKVLQARVRHLGLSNVDFFPRETSERIRSVLAKADALLVHLKDEELCRICIPQKVQAYLSAGRPVLMAVKGDAEDLVKSARAGVFCDPEIPESIAAGVRKLMHMTSEERLKMGENGRSFYNRELSFSIGTQRISDIIVSVKTGTS